MVMGCQWPCAGNPTLALGIAHVEERIGWIVRKTVAPHLDLGRQMVVQVHSRMLHLVPVRNEGALQKPPFAGAPFEPVEIAAAGHEVRIAKSTFDVMPCDDIKNVSLSSLSMPRCGNWHEAWPALYL